MALKHSGRSSHPIIRLEPDYEGFAELFKSGQFRRSPIPLIFPGDSSHGVSAAKVLDSEGGAHLDLVIKPHYNLRQLEREIAALRHITALKEPELPSLKPVGFLIPGEKHQPDLPHGRASQSLPAGYLFTEYEPGVLPLLRVNLKGMPRSMRQSLLHEVGEFVAIFHCKGRLFHGDLRAKNILFKIEHQAVTGRSTNFPHFFLADLENALIGPLTDKKRIAELTKLQRDLYERFRMSKTEFYNHIALPYEQKRKQLDGVNYSPIDWNEVFKPRLFGLSEH